MHIETTQQSRRSRRPIAAAVLGLSLLTVTAAGCGSDDDSASTTTAVADDATTTAGEEMAETTAGEEMAETTAGEEMAETTAAGDEGGSTEGEGMSADGSAKMEIGPDWTDMTEQTGIAAWQVGEVVDGFGPNVNLQSQPSPGVDVKQYIDLTKQQLEAASLTMVDSGTTTGPNGQELGYVEYTGDVGQGELHFMSYLNIANDKIALATFTAPDPTFGDLIGDVKPFLETVEVVQ